jgi:hypothetical protein
VSQDAGHADMAVTYRIYTHIMRLDGDQREHLRTLVEGAYWAQTGTMAPEAESAPESRGFESGSRISAERA